jgi:hypothetical protein
MQPLQPLQREPAFGRRRADFARLLGRVEFALGYLELAAELCAVLVAAHAAAVARRQRP